MPELPDVEAYIAALRPRTVGAVLERVRIRATFVLRTYEPPVSAIEGQRVAEIRRIGKRIAFGFENGMFLVVHLMIAGRLHWRDAGAKIGGRNDLAAFDFSTGTLTLTEAGTKHRASVSIVADEAALQFLDPGGIDVMNVSLDAFRLALSEENHTLKRALTDPHIIDGVGNAYSDEILHAAKLSPILQTKKMSDEQWKALYEATRETLAMWRDRLVEEAANGFPEKVTAFRPDMAVHGKFKKPCPQCGSPVQRISYADNETNYCATCQTGRKLLADRSLSRLLKDDWPRTLEELESRRGPKE